MKHRLAEVAYNKLTEFIDNTLPVLDRLNGYITGIDVWLGESGPAAYKKVTEAAANNAVLGDLHNVLQRHYVYLPQELVEAANALFVECLFLHDNPSHIRVTKCYDLLLGFENAIRRAVGAQELSIDLMKALRSHGRPPSTEARKKRKPKAA
jgi:hypothetical protein